MLARTQEVPPCHCYIHQMFSVLRCRNLRPASSTMMVHSRGLYRRGVDYFFKKNLLLTNSLTSGGFMMIGDLIQQELEYDAKKLHVRYDWARSARMFTVGAFMGPAHHYYYLYLDKLIPKVNLKTVIQKIMWDQIIASPLTITAFFFGLNLLEGKSLEHGTREFRDKFMFVYLGDCMFWPPVQFINFYFLPTHYRVFYINFATMVFNVFLSYSKHEFVPNDKS